VFVAVFTGVVLGSLAGLGLLVADLAGDSVELTALDGSEAVAATLVRVSLEPGDVRGGTLGPDAFEELTRSAIASGVVDDVRLWRRGEGLVRDMQRNHGGRVARSASLDDAFGGVITSAIADDAAGADAPGRAPGRCEGAQEMRVFVPLFSRGRPVQEVLELCSASAPVAQAAGDRRRGLLAVVLIGALMLWLVVLPAVLRAAHLLAERADRRHRPLVRALRRAMRRDELALHFQPKLSLESDEVDGVEALLRWRHPVHGDIPPLAYLPAAEQTEVIGDLTLHVLALAVRQVSEWRRDGLDVAIAVNVAPAALADPRLAPDLAAMLEAHGVPASSVTLEITEGALSESGALAGGVQNLAAVGVCLSIDDFGTGESSLGRLDAMPLHELKIDRVFVKRVASGGAPTLLAGVIRLGQELGLKTVAEGVEDADMVECLRSLDCDAIQGFHVSRPLPAAQIERWLRDRPAPRPQPVTGRFRPTRTSVRPAPSG
jgi:EAL domain-containing protein (putative c-di-GMP-specific phosphodiesterase class I)